MVYGVVRNHEGAVKIDSEPGKGTTVTLHLPATTSQEIYPQIIRSETPRLSNQTGRVLVIDDELVIRRSLKRLLEKLGYAVSLAPSGRVGVEIFEREGGDISLVFLDLIMPEMDGYETFSKLKAIDPRAKVFLLSGYAKNENVDRLLNEGAIGFLQKPFDLKGLSDALDGVCNKRASGVSGIRAERMVSTRLNPKRP